MNKLLRLLLGIGVGIGIAVLLPPENAVGVFDSIRQVIIHIGRYILFPLLFFKIVASIVEHTGQLSYMRLHFYLLALSVVVTAILVALGSVIILLLSPPRIPLIYQAVSAFTIPTFTEILKEVFPTNFFLVFSRSGDFLLPMIVAALIIGYAMRKVTKQNDQLTGIFNTLSEIFNKITEILIGLLAFGTIVLSAYFTVNIRLVNDISIFLQFILILLSAVVVIIFGLYPLIARILKVGNHSYSILSQLLIPALVGAISGDSYFATPVLLKSLSREYPKSRGELTHIVAHGAIFTKPGTALVTAVSFFVVLQSYSALGVELVQVLWFLLLAILLSPIASAYPSRGVIVFLALLTSLYGRGIEEAYLILVPIVTILSGVAILIDTITTGFIGHIVLQKILYNPSSHIRQPSDAEGKKKRVWKVTKTIIS